MAGRPVRRARLAAQSAAQADVAEEPQEPVEGEVLPAEGDLKQRAGLLHLRGFTAKMIAEQLEVTVTEAKRLTRGALTERVAAANLSDEVRTEIARLDVMLAAIWPRVERGNFEAIDRALALSERRQMLVNPKTNDHALRKGVDATVGASEDLDPVDAALVATMRKIADHIDDAVATQRGETLTKALYLVPHLMSFLKEMGATPAARKALHGEAEVQVTGKLAQLRQITSAKTKNVGTG